MENRRFVNYAHRGASEYAPENTKSSFDLGIEMKADGIETDVQITLDGVLVLFHNDKLDGRCNKTGMVCDYTIEQLEEMDFGSWKDPKYAGEKIMQKRPRNFNIRQSKRQQENYHQQENR